MLLIALAVLLVLAATLGFLLWPTKAETPAAANSAKSAPTVMPQTAREWLTAAFASAKAQGSVHMDVVDVLKDRTLRYSDDDGPIGGVQHISLTPGMAAEVRVVGKQTFFTANRAAFQGYFGFPARVAPIVAGHWLLVEPGMPYYEKVTEGVAFTSAMKEVSLKGHLRLLPARVLNGVRVVGLQGRAGGPAFDSGAPVRATLWVTDTSRALPVRYDAREKSLGHMTVTFTRWGDTAAVAPPASAVPLTRLMSSGSNAASG